MILTRQCYLATVLGALNPSTFKLCRNGRRLGPSDPGLRCQSSEAKHIQPPERKAVIKQ